MFAIYDFGLENDPVESTDLSAKYPQVKEDLIRKYEQFLRSFTTQISASIKAYCKKSDTA